MALDLTKTATIKLSARELGIITTGVEITRKLIDYTEIKDCCELHEQVAEVMAIHCGAPLVIGFIECAYQDGEYVRTFVERLLAIAMDTFNDGKSFTGLLA